MERHVKEIVITGGPCSGKSEALKIIPKRLRDMGYTVMILREVAEDIFSSVFRLMRMISESFSKNTLKNFMPWKSKYFLK